MSRNVILNILSAFEIPVGSIVQIMFGAAAS